MNGAHTEAVDAKELEQRCQTFIAAGGRMQMAYAWFPGGGSSAEVLYLAAPAKSELQIWRVRPAGNRLPSLAAITPLLSWYEREITDLCGVRFDNQPQPEPLVLLAGVEPGRPPLAPGAADPLKYVASPTHLPQLAGPEADAVQLLPFGPIRADVVESAQFLYYYLGEAIVHYHPQLFFKHRGMEKRFEGVKADLGAVLAERVSGVGSVAHALAFCRAVEAAAGCKVPARAEWLRVVLAELERLYNHLHYLGHLCHTTTLKVGEAQGKYLEELAKQVNARATGSRLLRGLLIPGGLRRALDLEGLEAGLKRIHDEFRPYARMLETTETHLDRLLTTGLLSHRLAFDQGATGPVERASGLDRDLRRDRPYAAYEQLSPRVATATAGDAHARQKVRIAEIENSFGLILTALKGIPAGALRASCAFLPGAEGLGWAESPRGSLYYAVHGGADGRLVRVKIKSPSFSNWRVFPFTVHDSNMMDYAINEASFGLTIAGCDR